MVSERRKEKSGGADVGVFAWAEAVQASELLLSAITILELGTGVLRLNGATQPKVPCCERGSISIYCRVSAGEYCQSEPQWRAVAPGYMCLTLEPSATR